MNRQYRRVAKFALPLLFALLNSCAWSPGMVYQESAPIDGNVDTSSTFQGMTVRLRSITPTLVTAQKTQTNQVSVIPADLLGLKPGPYKLGHYDVVTVTVWEHPELTSPLGQYRSDIASGQMVDENGGLFFPYAGVLKADGLTSNQLRDQIITSLSKVLNNPQLDVKVTGFRSQRVSVYGSVMRPGVAPVTDIPMTLLDAVTGAGGISPDGDASQVELTRAGRTYLLNLYAQYPSEAGPANVLLQNGDVVRVLSRTDAKVYLLGEVQKQSAIPLNNGHMSLVEALAEVGGLSPLTAQSKGIYVIRSADSSHIEVYHLNARNPLALVLGDQFPLKPRDVVFVDATGLARWNRVIGLILPTAQLIEGASQTAVNVQSLAK